MITNIINQAPFRRLVLISLFAFGLILSVQLASPHKVDAAYEHGRLIDNSVFLDAQSMSAAQIQSFLASKGAGLANMSFLVDCDLAGQQAKQIYQSIGAPCGQNAPASHIIYYASQVYGVSPKVTLATMQKEQSLTTASNPTSWQINQAMGYNCPTSGSCDDDSGFFYQIDNGTWVLRYHYERANGNNSWWSPSSGWTCGTGKPSYYMPNLYPGQNVNFIDPYSGVHYVTVYIQNAATSAFYCYTPHVFNNHNNSPHPNEPKGSSRCYSSHPTSGDRGRCYTGSYNFVYFFDLWFGSSTRYNGGVTLKTGLTLDKSTYSKGDTIQASFIIENTSSLTADVGVVGICARINGINYDFGTVPVSLNPQTTRTITFSRTIDRSGILSVFVCSYNNHLGGWVGHYYPYSSDSTPRQRDAFVYDNPLITTGLLLSPDNPSLGQSVTASFTVTNSSSNPVTIPVIGVAVRDPGGANVGYPGDSNVIIPANSTYSYSKSRIFSGTPGIYQSFITSFRNSNWDDNYPASSGSALRASSFHLRDNPLITTSLTISPTNPTLYQPVTASFTVTNSSSTPITIPVLGVAVRDSRNMNVGYPGDTNVVVPANGSYTYTKTRSFSESIGTYRFFTTSFRNNTWDDNYPTSNTGVQRALNAVVSGNPAVITNLKLSPSNPTRGQSVTASFTVRNNSSSPVTIPVLGVAVRDPNGANVGYPGDTNVVIAPNDSYTYSKSRVFDGSAGSYRFFITSFRDNTWDDAYPVSLYALLRSVVVGIP